jgi:hypothetical protein
VLGGVGFDLGAIERNMPKLDQASSLAQLQDLRKQRLQRPSNAACGEMVRKSGTSNPTMLMKSTSSRHALAIRREE